MLPRLSKLLGVGEWDVEDVLRNDEARAKDTVNRRRFMGASAALATAPFVPKAWVEAVGPLTGYEHRMCSYGNLFGVDRTVDTVRLAGLNALLMDHYEGFYKAYGLTLHKDPLLAKLSKGPPAGLPWIPATTTK